MGEQGTTLAVESGPWKDVALLLLQAAADHAVHCGTGEVEPFRKLVRESIKGLEGATESAQILMSVGAVTQAIARYSAHTQQQFDAMRNGSAGSVRTPQHEDTSGTDPCTGLPKRQEAEAALAQAIGQKRYGVVFYLHRMPLTISRFGDAIGDQVAIFCSQHVASVMAGPGDALFRWSGPVFLAILDRKEATPAVIAEVQKVTSASFSRIFETPARSVYLPVKITADVIALFDTTQADVTQKIEGFIQKASGQMAGD